MATTYYTEIRDTREHPAIVEVIKRAELLGYPLIRFNGWSDSEIGTAAFPGTRRVEVVENRARLNEITDSLVGHNGYDLFIEDVAANLASAECPWCAGSGYVPATGVMCHTCRGTGEQRRAGAPASQST